MVSPQPSPQYNIPFVAPAQQPGPVDPGRRRLDSIDLLRGIVMVVMMLDHTRDFVHNAVYQFDPTDPTHTNLALFFTRWITHFCAPVFVFLAGTGAYLQFARGKSKRELSRFLVTRGIWLIVLEVTIVKLGEIGRASCSEGVEMWMPAILVGLSADVVSIGRSS